MVHAGDAPAQPAAPVQAVTAQAAAPAQPAAPAQRTSTARPGRPAGHLVLLAGYLVTGLAVTWPRVSYLWGKLPNTRDVGGYVWDFWWVAHQLSHLSSPWTTSYLAAPVGSSLGYHTLMPLP